MNPELVPSPFFDRPREKEDQPSEEETASLAPGGEVQRAYERLRLDYFDPGRLTSEELERFLSEGEVRNIRAIEEFGQPVSPHANRVLLGQMVPREHKDLVLEGELVLPDMTDPLLVIYKPESGVNKGTDRGREIPLPSASSPYYQKEIAAWRVGREIGLNKLLVPVISRELGEGVGSLRPYIWGEPVELLAEETKDLIYKEAETMEDIALYDYLLQTMDRREANLLWVADPPGGQVKMIDHSLTFFDETFAEDFTKKGPRLMVAWDNTADPPRLRQYPLPDRWQERLGPFLEDEERITADLADHLTGPEIRGIFDRARQVVRRNILL